LFTGIIEQLGTLKESMSVNGNVCFRFSAPMAAELKVDQSLSHNGVCLTVDSIDSASGSYTVTAIPETLRITNLGDLNPGDLVNLERCMPANGRFDGHIVQGHVDTTGVLESVEEDGGSFILHVSFNAPKQILVPKGSICMNGISLTIVDCGTDFFTVAIIPYTWEHTNLKSLKKGDRINLEFDILGKYMSAWLSRRES
jgi:riboflavin synthase